MYDDADIYIEQHEGLDYLRKYLVDSQGKICVVTAPSGSGKTILLSKFAQEVSNNGLPTIYRSVGISDQTATENELVSGILSELKYRGILKKEIPSLFDEKILQFEELLNGCTGQKFIVIIDGLDQLNGTLETKSWLPKRLANNVKMIIGYKPQTSEDISFDWLKVYELPQLFEEKEVRRQYARQYLSKYLKDIDDDRLDLLIDIPAAKNPLCLKVILSELRVYGSFDQLIEKIKKLSYTEPERVFSAILERLEKDPVYSELMPVEAIPAIMGAVSYSRTGLAVNELQSILHRFFKGKYSEQQCRDAVLLYFRQLRPYLLSKDGYTIFRYDSLRRAAEERYDANRLNCHTACADYFRSMFEQDASKSVSERAYKEYLYHIAFVDQKELSQRLMDYNFIDSMLNTCNAESLASAYAYIHNPLLIHDVLGISLSLSAHAINENHNDIPSQLWNRICDIQDVQIQGFLQEMRKKVNYPWLKGMHATLSLPYKTNMRKYVLPGNVEHRACSFVDDYHYFAVWIEEENENPTAKKVCCGIVDLLSCTLMYRVVLGLSEEIPAPFNQIVLSSDRSRFVSIRGTAGRISISCRDALTGYIVSERVFEMDGLRCYGDVSPNLKYVKCSTSDGYVIYDLNNGEVIYRNREGLNTIGLRYSNNDQYLAYVDAAQRNLYVIDILKGNTNKAFSRVETPGMMVRIDDIRIRFSDDSKYLLFNYSEGVDYDKIRNKQRGHSLPYILLLTLKMRVRKAFFETASSSNMQNRINTVVYDVQSSRVIQEVQNCHVLTGCVELDDHVIAGEHERINYLTGERRKSDFTVGRAFKTCGNKNVPQSYFATVRQVSPDKTVIEYYDNKGNQLASNSLGRPTPDYHLSPAGMAYVETNNAKELSFCLIGNEQKNDIPDPISAQHMQSNRDLVVDVSNSVAIPYKVNWKIRNKKNGVKTANGISSIAFDTSDMIMIDTIEGMKRLTGWGLPRFCQNGGVFVQGEDQKPSTVFERYIGESQYCYAHTVGIRMQRIRKSLWFAVKSEGKEKEFYLPLLTKEELKKYGSVCASDISDASYKRLCEEVLLRSPVSKGISNPFLPTLNSTDRTRLLSAEMPKIEIADRLNALICNRTVMSKLEKDVQPSLGYKWTKSYRNSSVIRKLAHRDILFRLYGIARHCVLPSTHKVLAVDERLKKIVYTTDTGVVIQNLDVPKRIYLPETELASVCPFVERSWLVGLHEDAANAQIRVYDYGKDTFISEIEINEAQRLWSVNGDSDGVYYSSSGRICRVDLNSLIAERLSFVGHTDAVTSSSPECYSVIDRQRRMQKLITKNGEKILEHYTETYQGVPQELLIRMKTGEMVLYQGHNRVFVVENY